MAGISHSKLEEMGRSYAKKYAVGDQEDIRAFEKGYFISFDHTESSAKSDRLSSACLAQQPHQYATVAGLTDEEMSVLDNEYKNRWSQPRVMYLTIVLCATCAAVQVGTQRPFDTDSRFC